jgi:hypothetical protein
MLQYSNFRLPSQQILLRSLTLADYTPSYYEARVLLTESPHVTGYIKNFDVRLFKSGVHFDSIRRRRLPSPIGETHKCGPILNHGGLQLERRRNSKTQGHTRFKEQGSPVVLVPALITDVA